MSNVPFGVARLDSILGGGAPPGSVVLLSGESGAGAREFLYTSAAMNVLARDDEELFDLYYGELEDSSEVPPEVHYVSFTSGKAAIERELGYTMADEIAAAAAEGIRFADLSTPYFQLSPIPRDWYHGEPSTIGDLGERERHGDVLSELGEYLSRHATGNLVVIDSVTDLVSSISEEMGWNDIAMVMKGLKKAAHHWGGLILLLVNEDTLTDTERGILMDAVSGTFRFTWETGGSQRARTMVVREFRGVLSRLEEENIIRFETEIHEGGFDVTDVRKIR
ncbi:RAD55 family ATPase [Halopenitus persicus]|uniref:RAD55 family ATPase n=1 Tax=Halopenitus persicus TaxID=1048396 RepID=UPI000BBAE26B|nr:HTR-like protein [Halopenitus persicus]